VERLDADLLIPGRGDPIVDGTVLIDSGAITYAGPRSGIPPEAAQVQSVKVPVLMPGMWECHGHFMGLSTMDLVGEMPRTSVAVLAARAVPNVETALQAGFTSVREAGGLGVELAKVVEEGFISGPTIYAPGSILSMTGGHGDLHSYPIGWVHELCERQGFTWLCDGVPECLKAVRMQLRKGAKTIKICASGGVMSEIDHPVHQQFSDEELRAIVEEAGRADRVVMAHCHGKPGIMAALRAGVHTIEHGSYLDEEAADAMRESGAVLVPTRLIVEEGLKMTDRLPEYAAKKMEMIADAHKNAMTLAYESGVKIALGTDIFASVRNSGLQWGNNGRELAYFVDVGMTPLEAIEAGTASCPSTLGPQAPKSGLLADGYDADLIAISSNPLDDISVLGDPKNVTHVWKAGALVKSPGPS
jgi:imidazolonepropionase-like amidohydrolase